MGSFHVNFTRPLSSRPRIWGGFALTMTLAYSLMHGNIASGFRQRAQIFIILFIYSSYEWYLIIIIILIISHINTLFRNT